MGQIIVRTYPIEVILEHDDVVTGTYVDEWGTVDTYTINKVYWTEKAGSRWVAIVVHPSTGNPVIQEVLPGEVGEKNLPAPARFPSYPLTTHITLLRA